MVVQPVGNALLPQNLLPQVVSDRAIKHVHELTQLHVAGRDASGPLRCAVLFVVNRADCAEFRWVVAEGTNQPKHKMSVGANEMALMKPYDAWKKAAVDCAEFR